MDAQEHRGAAAGIVADLANHGTITVRDLDDFIAATKKLAAYIETGEAPAAGHGLRVVQP